MSGKRVKLEADLFERIVRCAEKAGYATPEEFVVHVMEKEVARLEAPTEPPDSEEEVKRRLRGLGYIE